MRTRRWKVRLYGGAGVADRDTEGQELPRGRLEPQSHDIPRVPAVELKSS